MAGETSKANAPKGRVIVTYSRGWQTLVAVRSLGKHGVEVVTGAEYKLTPSSFSRYSIGEFLYPNPTTDPQGFLDVLEENVIRYKPEDPSVPYVIMPIHKESYLIARHRERFEPHISMAMADIELIEKVHNKGTLASYAQEHGVPTPTTWIPDSIEEFQSSMDRISLPAFVKLRESAAGVGIQKVDTKEELQETFNEFVERFKVAEHELPIIQAAVPGDDYCVTTLFDHGRLVTSMTYRNLRAYPPEKGAGVMRETVQAPEMERVSAELLGSLGWHGVAQLDFRWDGNKASPSHLIEVNPRFWGGLIQAVESGWDYPWLLFCLAADGKVPQGVDPKYDIRTETPILAFLATLKEIAENDQGEKLLKAAWEEAKQEFTGGSKRAGLRLLFDGIKQLLDEKPRTTQARELLKHHQDNIYDILCKDDPLPALGIFYPLAILLRHGKINMELITGEGNVGSDDKQ